MSHLATLNALSKLDFSVQEFSWIYYGPIQAILLLLHACIGSSELPPPFPPYPRHSTHPLMGKSNITTITRKAGPNTHVKMMAEATLSSHK